MNKNEYNKFIKRYDKFKNNNLPTPFWDDERQMLEYVYRNENNRIKINEDNIYVSRNIVDALEDVVKFSFYYSYSAKVIGVEDENHYFHAHSFEEVVTVLYNYPESFKISKDDEIYYSKQELEYLRSVQKYLLFIGMKDIENHKIKKSRYKNKLHSKYSDCYIYKFSNEMIKKFVSREINYIAKKMYDYDTNDFKSYKALFIDENGNFKLYVKFIRIELKEDCTFNIYFEILEQF